ncbi:T9SS type A sorting domain-containing protein [candidate division KSB1 bacterium]|nr:T9SS type A sorting domain-containing protein [candidate division KSB1 bacterium]
MKKRFFNWLLLGFVIPALWAPSILAVTFTFDSGNLQGWTMQGIYAYETYPTTYTNPFTLTWNDKTQYPGDMDDDPTGNNIGSALAFAENFDLPGNYPSNTSYWFIDLVSPDVTSDPEWQNIIGVSASVFSLYPHPQIQFQVLLNATRKSDGQPVWLKETLSGDLFHDLRMGAAGWKNLMAVYFSNLGNYTINNIRFRIFGDPDLNYGACKFYIDNVAPLTTRPQLGLQGKVQTGVIAEGCNYLTVWYESDFKPACYLTRIRVDFTGSNVDIATVQSMCSQSCPQITNLEKISDRILEITCSGFGPGEWIEIAPNLNQHSSGTGSPLGGDYVGAVAYLTFSNLPGEIVVPIAADFEYKGAFEAEAPFSIAPPSDMPPPPSDLQVHTICGQLHLTWRDNSDNETGFKVERLITPAPMPLVWSVLATLDANVTSFQMDNPVNNTTYNFRISAFNDAGTSDYSNVVTLKTGLSLMWLCIDVPTGGEVWSIGSTQEIVWRSSTFNRPSHVNIRYSTDGGSNWISPPIASMLPNTDSYLWTVPDTPSEKCIVKVEDAHNGSFYDLSNASFTIQLPTLPLLSVSPAKLNFGTDLNSLALQITNTGGGTLEWDITETPEKPWITSISPASGINNGTVTISVDRNLLVGNTDSGELSVTSNGGNASVPVTISRGQELLPPHWNFTGMTGNNAVVILPVAANPNIDGQPLEDGDYIGVFTPSGLCCGWSQWNGTNCSITVWGDDSQTTAVDGFRPGEKIDYRVYRVVAEKEWNSIVTEYSQGNGLFAVDALLVLSRFDVLVDITMTLQFNKGWNMFSIHVEPDPAGLVEVMAPIIDHLVLVKDSKGKTFIPEFEINDIGNIDYKQGYKTYLKQPVPLDVVGKPVDASTPIDLPAGWSMISYLPVGSMAVETALAGIHDCLVIVKDNMGQTYIPLYGINTIGHMQPGQGYQIYLSTSATLVYPADIPPQIAGLNGNTAGQPGTEHYQFTANTGDNATVVVPVAANPQFSDGSALATGDEIGVFTTLDVCCGATIWQSVNTAITVWGDDVITEGVDGFTAGDTFRFRVWKKSGNLEFPAIVEFRTSDPVVYTSDGISVLNSLVADMTSAVREIPGQDIPVTFGLSENYPNPFNSVTVIQFQTPQPAKVMLTVYDLNGHLVRRLVEENVPAGCYSTRWDGRDTFGHTVASGFYFYRIEMSGNNSGGGFYRDVKKMVFIK